MFLVQFELSCRVKQVQRHQYSTCKMTLCSCLWQPSQRGTFKAKLYRTQHKLISVHDCHHCDSCLTWHWLDLLLKTDLYRETAPPRPYKECSSNPHTVFVLTAHGGHCAHLPLGSWVTGKAWMDKVAMQFFAAVSNIPHLSKPSANFHGTPDVTDQGSAVATASDSAAGDAAPL